MSRLFFAKAQYSNCKLAGWRDIDITALSKTLEIAPTKLTRYLRGDAYPTRTAHLVEQERILHLVSLALAISREEVQRRIKISCPST